MRTILQRYNLLQGCTCLCHYYVSVLKARKQEQKESFKYKYVLVGEDYLMELGNTCS